MKFRTPWIDPRVEEVRPVNLLAYLENRKWIETPSRRAPMRAFCDAKGNGIIFVPDAWDYDRYVQDIIDAVTLLAKIENRYAGDVLTDLLARPAAAVDAQPTAPAVPDKGDVLARPVMR